MAVQNLYSARKSDRPPTSREINEAIEIPKDARADPQAVRLLDVWNAHRLVEAAQRVETNEELRNLFTGLRDRGQSGDLSRIAFSRPSVKDEGPWT